MINRGVKYKMTYPYDDYNYSNPLLNKKSISLEAEPIPPFHPDNEEQIKEAMDNLRKILDEVYTTKKRVENILTTKENNKMEEKDTTNNTEQQPLEQSIERATREVQGIMRDYEHDIEFYTEVFAELLGLEEKKHIIELKQYLIDIMLYDDYPIEELPKIIDELRKISNTISIYLDSEGINIIAPFKKSKDD